MKYDDDDDDNNDDDDDDEIMMMTQGGGRDWDSEGGRRRGRQAHTRGERVLR